MERALVIGGTRFIGRALVAELLDHDYEVTLLNRGRHENPFGDAVGHVAGDRGDRAVLETARERVAPDVVFDCVAFAPAAVEAATEVFEASTYVYISSTHAYRATGIPKRESTTPLRPCTPNQATDDGSETYGNRKAEADRVAMAAAERGVDARIVRPTATYGPGDYTERLAYWVDRVASHDRVLVPGEGSHNVHLVHVDDVASALRLVAERGSAGEAYNVADRRFHTLDELLERIAEALGTSVELVHASSRELPAGLEPADFVLYRPYPYVVATEKLAGLGWEPTPLSAALPPTVEAHRRAGRDGREYPPTRDRELEIIESLEG
jgi:nucleoside-diphosphate-sugar epimerase